MCFPAGTLISTAAGFKPIEQILIGDRVWAFNLVTGQWALRTVEKAFTAHYENPLVEITVADETIRSTMGHPFWVIEGDGLCDRPKPEHIVGIENPNATVPGRWVDSHDLRIGDVLLLKDQKPARITAVNLRPWSGQVYNFAVDDLHCYAVGENAVLVHNVSDCNFVSLEELVNSAKSPGKLATELAQKLGKAGEDAAEIVKNTTRIDSLSGKAAFRTPDELTLTTLTEVKNVHYQDFSTQLQDSLHYAIMTSRQMILKVRPDTILSTTLQDAIKSGWIKLEFLP
jgi:hypothetical protein